MRVSSNSIYYHMRLGLGAALSRAQIAQEQLATGRKVNKYSDAPTDAVNIQRQNSALADYANYKRSMTDATSWLGTQDSALQSMSTVIQRANELVLAGVNGAADGISRGALADEIDGIVEQLASLANTSYDGRQVFGGFGAAAVTKNAAGQWVFTGDNGAVLRQVSPTQTMQINADGAQLLGFNAGAGQDIFSVLQQASADLRANNSAGLQTAATAVMDRLDDVLTALQSVGARANTVERMGQVADDEILFLKNSRSDLQDVDVAEATIAMQAATNGYTAALGAAAKANLPTLAQFLN